MQNKYLWIVLKVLELLLNLICCCLLFCRCCQTDNYPRILALYGILGLSLLIGLTSLITLFLAEQPNMKYEAGLAGLLGALHLVAVYLHISMATMEECKASAMVALCAAGIYLLHYNLALSEMFSYGRRYPDPPLMMPPFLFKRSGVPEVYMCQPLSSPNGPSGLPQV